LETVQLFVFKYTPRLNDKLIQSKIL